MRTKYGIPMLSVITCLVLIGCSAEAPSSNGTDKSGKQEGKPQASQAATEVRTAQVERKKIQGWIYSQGTARSRHREFLTFTQQGMVSHVDDDLRVGSPLKAGQLIAHQAPERVQANLQAARAALAEAQASLKLAGVTQQRYENLTKQRSASKQELDEAKVEVQRAKAMRDNANAELAQAQLDVDESRLVSPIDGVLARLNIEKGRYFMPNTVQTSSEQDALRTVPALVIDPDEFEVRVDLPSYDYRRIATGTEAVIGSRPPTHNKGIDPRSNERSVRGLVHAISPSLDPETRTFEVIVHTQETQPGLQDGEFVAVWIAEPAQEQALVVPLEALRFRNDQAFVFVVDEASGKATQRQVELGQQSGDERAVISGVEEGEWVVTDGRAALHDGQLVHVLPAKEST